jgi:energy-coupling factor transporter ATP-binding protein EcfA2
MLPEDFWDARPTLRHIRQAAHSRARSGDIVFGGLLARLSSLLPPELRADTGVGSPACMNMFVVLLGASGSGKSSAAWIPRRLLPPPPRIDFLDELPLGSGEGIAEAYMGEQEVETGEIFRGGPKKGDPKTETVRAQIRHNALFYADEGEALTKQLFGRNGATVGESLRRAWTGGTIGQFNGHKINTRVIESGTYSLGMVIGFQPETALPLLEDAPAGTPQRFLWFSSIDPSIPEDVVDDPGLLDLALIRRGFGLQPAVTFATELLRQIRVDDRARATGETRLPPLDSHKPLMLVKLAALLAILDNRVDVVVEDWQLAETVWATSCELRDALLEYGARQVAEDAEKKTRAHVDRELRAHTAKARSDQDVERVARRAAKRVHEHGPMTRSALNRMIAHRDRDRLGVALDFAEALGWLVCEADQVLPGDSRPS